jgi:hypothetical protein
MAGGLQLKHRDLRGTVGRAATVAARFGVTAGPFARRLATLTAVAAEHGARPTLPVTACVLARHPALIRSFSERGVEFAIHGLVHNDHAVLTVERQRETIAEAAGIFRAAGVPYAGFRGPYLRWNRATDEACRELGLLYHSSRAVLFHVLPPELQEATATGDAGRILRLYRAQPAEARAVRPRLLDGLVDLPVATPDDEIMVERLGLGAEAQTAAWRGILDQTHARGDLFTLQLHPERAFECAGALGALLHAANQRRPHVWLARLDEIAAWWRRRAAAPVRLERVDGRWHASLPLAGGTLLVRGERPAGAEHWHDPDVVVPHGRAELRSERRPVVGISTRSRRALQRFVEEEGFVTEVTDRAGEVGAHLDQPGALDEASALAALEAAVGPLVRSWRWPDGARSALAVTGDVDSVTVQDFAFRLWETRR